MRGGGYTKCPRLCTKLCQYAQLCNQEAHSTAPVQGNHGTAEIASKISAAHI